MNAIGSVAVEQTEVLDGRYRLVRPLAKVTSGGYVYVGEHVFTRKPCAVKVLDRNVAEKVRKRMRREMDALATVQGPGVVEFRDAGESDGQLYIVLELLEGRTLAGLLAAKGKLDIDQAAKVSADIADALARCHERGVVHRDIKPANVFVTTGESVQLLDFGIAKVIDTRRELEKLTQENALLGTPEYMAPEALFSSPDADHRVDQYALGITLYECLAGVVPFEGAYAEVVRKVMSTPLRPIRELRPDTTAALADVIGRALQRDPNDRYASIVEMRDALRTATPSSTAHLFDHRHNARDAATLADAPMAKARAGTTRRRHARAPYVTLARILRQSTEHVDGRIEEISESGFQFVGDRAVPDGEPIVVRFASPVTGRIVEASATSRWSRSTRGLTAAGFEFTALPDVAVGEIRKYVSILCAD